MHPLFLKGHGRTREGLYQPQTAQGKTLSGTTRPSVLWSPAMLLTIAALAPLLTVFALLVLARWPATRAMPVAYAVAVVAGLWAWQMTPRVIAAASLRGMMIAASLL